MSSVAQMLKQADALKANITDSSKTLSETWGVRQKLEDLYKKVLLTDLEYALDKKVEQELWNHAFKNQITNLQAQAKDKQNLKRGEIQASLNLFLETASGFYLQFLQLICSTFKLDLPFRRKSSYYGILREKTPIKLKVTPPKKSSCLYVCQHCLVHLGDIARYRQQIDQAQTYYWHAASLVPFNGQPYNQLAILEAAKGNKLSTVFYYIRSLAVKVPFPVAATNLEKLYLKLTKETPEFKGKLSASEMITGFLQFHALVHLCTDFDKAEDLSQKLATGLPSHVTSQSFPWQVLVQIVAINIFSMHHVQYGLKPGLANGVMGLSGDEERCFDLVFTLTVRMLDILLQYTPKQENRLREYFTLPAIKLLLDWLKLNPNNFDRQVLQFSPLWGNLCRVLNCIQRLHNQQTQEKELDLTKYEEMPLPEDAELRCFQPIEKAQSSYSYSKLPSSGLPGDIEVQLRCERLLNHGRWIMEQHPSVNLSAEPSVGGQLEFTSSMPPEQTPITKTVTLSLPSDKSQPSPGKSTMARSPERRSARQNVAIQAIMQKQAQDKDKPRSKEDPTSPKYLLGVPTSEPPVFFKQGAGRQSQSNSPLSQSNASPKNATAVGNQHGGVLVLKNQEHLMSSNKASQQHNKSQAWQPSPWQQSATSWQQQQQSNKPQQQQQQKVQQVTENPGWTNTQTQQVNGPIQGQGQGQGQPSPWQQQLNAGLTSRPQLSPQAPQGPWQFPGQQGRGDYRPRGVVQGAPPLNQGPSQNIMASPSQGNMFPQAPPRHGFSQQQQQVKQSGPSAGSQHPFNKDSSYSNMSLTSGGNGLITNTMPTHQANNTGINNAGQGLQANQTPRERFSQPSQFNECQPVTSGPLRPPGHMAMFRHPPPGTRFNQSNSGFPNAPPMDLSASQQTGMRHPQGQLGSGGNSSTGNHGNFSHAPGTERIQAGRGTMGPQNQQMSFPAGPFLNPFPGFMGYPGLSTNQMKSPLESLFGKPQYNQDDIPASMANLIGTLSKMVVQPPQGRDTIMMPPRSIPSAFQGHAEGTPKPESYFSSQRGSTVPSVNIDLETKALDTITTETLAQPPHSPSQPAIHQQQQQQQQQQQGTYSLFSGSHWLASGDSKSLGSSPFSSQSSSIRNSPDPVIDAFSTPEAKLDMALRYSAGTEDRTHKHMAGDHNQLPSGPFFQNNMQSLWPNPGQSPLERLLELQKQQRQTDPH